jgi:hypothetical protein
MTTTPRTPRNDDEPWNWVGYDAKEAGILGVTIHFISRHPDGGWVIWFQKLTTSQRHLWVTLVQHLLATMFRVYLIIYKPDGTPYRVVIKGKVRDTNRIMTRSQLQSFMRENGQLK